MNMPLDIFSIDICTRRHFEKHEVFRGFYQMAAMLPFTGHVLKHVLRLHERASISNLTHSISKFKNLVSSTIIKRKLVACTLTSRNWEMSKNWRLPKCEGAGDQARKFNPMHLTLGLSLTDSTSSKFLNKTSLCLSLMAKIFDQDLWLSFN